MKHVMPAAVARLLVAIGTIPGASSAEAIPAFARRTQFGCNACHTLYPQLNRLGRDFRDNGFRTPDEVEPLLRRKPQPPPPPQPAAEEDFWSFIPGQIPFSIQA